MGSIGSTARAGGAPDAGARLLLFRGRDELVATDVLHAAQEAVAGQLVLVLDYVDGDGEPTTRAVEPAGLLRGVEGWYLVGWCRLRGDGRSFRLDRIQAARVTGERVPRHEVRDMRADVPAGWAALPQEA